ncbi:MAG: hypothetical protein WAL30_01995 [Candidatus Aquirickettsiella sp.]
MATINKTKENNVKNFVTEENQKTNLLNYLTAKKNSELRVAALKKLIYEDKLENFELKPIQLKLILSLFSEHRRFVALELLVKHSTIIMSKPNALKNFELESTQLITILSLFHGLNRFIALEHLVKLFAKLLPKSEKLQFFELKPAQLKAILFLFAPNNRFEVLKFLKKNFDIKIPLTQSDIKELETCLSRDYTFASLLPFAKKNLWDSFFVKHEKEPIAHAVQNKTKANLQLNNFRYNTFSKSGNQAEKKAVSNRNKLSLTQLRVSILQHCPKAELRLKFFNDSEIKNYTTIISSINIEAFKHFIEVFPPQDAIKFLNIRLISNQIASFRRQNCQLTQESYSDLLTYFKPYQQDSVKKLLRPISPVINMELLKLGTFKESKAKPAAYTHTPPLPDLVRDIQSRAK